MTQDYPMMIIQGLLTKDKRNTLAELIILLQCFGTNSTTAFTIESCSPFKLFIKVKIHWLKLLNCEYILFFYYNKMNNLRVFSEFSDLLQTKLLTEKVIIQFFIIKTSVSCSQDNRGF